MAGQGRTQILTLHLWCLLPALSSSHTCLQAFSGHSVLAGIPGVPPTPVRFPFSSVSSPISSHHYAPLGWLPCAVSNQACSCSDPLAISQAQAAPTLPCPTPASSPGAWLRSNRAVHRPGMGVL